MAHNPPRPKTLDRESIGDVVSAVRRRRQWVSLDDLADKMIARAAQGKRVVLSPGTAEYLARWVRERCGSR